MNTVKKQRLLEFLESQESHGLADYEDINGHIEGLDIDLDKLPVDMAEILVEFGTESIRDLTFKILDDLIPDKDWEKVNTAFKMLGMGILSLGITVEQKLCVPELPTMDIPDDLSDLRAAYTEQFGQVDEEGSYNWRPNNDTTSDDESDS